MSHSLTSFLKYVCSGLMITSIGTALVLPASLHAAEWQTCPSPAEQFTASIGAMEGTVLKDTQETIAVTVMAAHNTTLVGTDVLAGFYRDGQLTAWMPVASKAVITSAGETFNVAIPQALTDGTYRMVVYVVPNAEDAKSFLFGDQVGAAALDVVVEYGNTTNVFKPIEASAGEVTSGMLSLPGAGAVDFTVTLNNPYDDKAVRGGLLLYAFAGLAPDQSKVQRMQNFEIKLVPNAQNTYSLSLEEIISGSYLMQAVYLAEDGAQYVVSLPVAVDGLPVEPAHAKFSFLGIQQEGGEKKIVACVDAVSENGNAFGAYEKNLETSIKVLDAEGGERIANTEAAGVFTMNNFPRQAVELTLPAVKGAFTIEATMMQEGEIVHVVKTEIDCQEVGVCGTAIAYDDLAPNVNIIKTAILTVVVGTIAVLTAAFVVHRRKPKVVGAPLPDNDSDI